MSMSTTERKLTTLIKEKRKAAGLSQGELAEKVGVCLSQISLLEAGKRKITVRVACKISEALNFSLAEVFKQSKNPASH